MVIVTTKIRIKPGKTEEVLQLFKETNPGLVEDQEDWVKAVFTANQRKNTVVVHAWWKEAESYFSFSDTEMFQNTMLGFAEYFDGEPEVDVHEILFEM